MKTVTLYGVAFKSPNQSLWKMDYDTFSNLKVARQALSDAERLFMNRTHALATITITEEGD